MNEAQILSMIRQAVRSELAPILMGMVVEQDAKNRVTVTRFQTDSALPNHRNIQPYGFASRAPVGMECLVVPVAGDSSHRNVVGHFDKAAPALEVGESAIYSKFGQSIVMKADGSIHLGAGGDAAAPMVLGDVLAEFLGKLIDEITTAPSIGIDSFGLPVQLDPALKAKLTELKTKYVTTASTNILSTKYFVERS